MEEQVTNVLLAAGSADAQARQNAEQWINAMKQQNLAALMLAMSKELADENKQLSARQLAGLVVKNCIAAKSADSVATQSAAWLAIEAAKRNEMKMILTSVLGSAVRAAGTTAAQVVAAIGLVEIPLQQWPELVSGLAKNVTTPESSANLKQSSLEAIGFLCDDIDPTAMTEGDTNQVLTAVIQGMNQAQPAEVRLAGAKALSNALEFVGGNFEKEAERNFIMQTICETTQDAVPDIKLAAFECIREVAELYYDKLPKYVEALFSITSKEIKQALEAGDADSDVAKQAIEFWTVLCEEENEIHLDHQEGNTERVLFRYAESAHPHLVPDLLKGMCIQEEDDDPEDWNISGAACTCLAAMAKAVGDGLVDNVMGWVTTNITNQEDWRLREAALSAFGSILEGPTENKLRPFLEQAVDVMVRLIADASVRVKETAAWSLGRICEHHVSAIKPQHWPMMLNEGTNGQPLGVVLMALRDAPQVAAEIGKALYFLADSLTDYGYEDSEAARQITAHLNAYFVTISTALLTASERSDAGERNLRISVYEALNQMIAACPAESHPHLLQLMYHLMQKLEVSFSFQIVSTDDRDTQSEIQGLLCAALQGITRELKALETATADKMMELYLGVLKSPSSTVHEEALMAIGAIADATEANFARYMEQFKPHLERCLANSEDYQVCQIAVGVVGDACRATETLMAPYLDSIVTLLMTALSNQMLNRAVKPPILSCFGDIALAIGGGFEKYLQMTMAMLQQAGNAALPTNNPEMAEYANRLREGICEAYTGVLQGLRAENKSELFHPFVLQTLGFMRVIAESKVPPNDTCSDDTLRAAVGVLGDLASAIGPNFKQVARGPPHKDVIKTLLTAAKESPNKTTKDVYAWAKSAVS